MIDPSLCAIFGSQGQLVDPLQHQVLQQQVMGVPQLSAGMDPALQAAQMQQMGYDPSMMQVSCLALMLWFCNHAQNENMPEICMVKCYIANQSTLVKSFQEGIRKPRTFSSFLMPIVARKISFPTCHCMGAFQERLSGSSPHGCSAS